MKKSEEFLKNAENCARLAASAPDAPARNRFERMEAAWLASTLLSCAPRETRATRRPVCAILGSTIWRRTPAVGA